MHTEARRQNDGQGLYKVWLRGGGKGRLLLGTLVPGGGELVLSRTLSRRTLEDAGCWPVAGGKAVMAYPFTEESAGEWYWEEEPWKLVSDPVLVQAARSWGPLLVQRGGEEVRLAASFRGGGQFPLVPLFCFGTVGQIRGREYVIFLFDRQGTPKMPYNLEQVSGRGPGEHRPGAEDHVPELRQPTPSELQHPAGSAALRRRTNERSGTYDRFSVQ